jgi:hypothetical protein
MNTSPLNAFLTLPIVAVLRRNVLLLLLLVGAVFLALDDRVFKILGGLIYAPALFLGTFFLVAVARHVFHRKTMDAYADPLITEQYDANGGVSKVPTFVDDFFSLSPEKRATLYVAQGIGYVIAGAIIISTVWK